MPKLTLAQVNSAYMEALMEVAMGRAFEGRANQKLYSYAVDAVEPLGITRETTRQNLQNIMKSFGTRDSTFEVQLVGGKQKYKNNFRVRIQHIREEKIFPYMRHFRNKMSDNLCLKKYEYSDILFLKVVRHFVSNDLQELSENFKQHNILFNTNSIDKRAYTQYDYIRKSREERKYGQKRDTAVFEGN